jgi:hypothetical protein
MYHMKTGVFQTDYNHTSHLLPLLSIQCMSRRDLSVKGGTSERCCTLYSCFHSQISIHLRKTPELCPFVRHANKQPRLNQTDESFEKIIWPKMIDTYTTGSSRLDPGFYGVRVVHICVFLSSCVALPIVCPSMILCFRCSGPFFGE